MPAPQDQCFNVTRRNPSFAHCKPIKILMNPQCCTFAKARERAARGNWSLPMNRERKPQYFQRRLPQICSRHDLQSPTVFSHRTNSSEKTRMAVLALVITKDIDLLLTYCKTFQTSARSRRPLVSYLALERVVNAEGTRSGKSLKSLLVICHPRWGPNRPSRPAITVDTWNSRWIELAFRPLRLQSFA